MLDPIEYYIEIRGNKCEICGQSNKYANWYERHHCLIRRSRRNDKLDNEINIELLCHSCHALGLGDTFEHRKEFAQRQIERGYQVGEWIRSLPLKYIEDWLLRL